MHRMAIVIDTHGLRKQQGSPQNFRKRRRHSRVKESADENVPEGGISFKRIRSVDENFW